MTMIYSHPLSIKAKTRFHLLGIKEPSLAIKRSQALPAIVELWSSPHRAPLGLASLDAPQLTTRTDGGGTIKHEDSAYNQFLCGIEYNLDFGQLVAT